MKKIAVIIALIVSQQVYSQGCFDKCRDHLADPLKGDENLECVHKPEK